MEIVRRLNRHMLFAKPKNTIAVSFCFPLKHELERACSSLRTRGEDMDFFDLNSICTLELVDSNIDSNIDAVSLF